MRWIWVLLLMIGSGGNAYAEDNAGAPVKILVAFQGSTTAVALNLADRTSALTGRSFFVEVKEGGTGRIAAMALKNAVPDGTTIALLPIALPVVVPLIAGTSRSTRCVTSPLFHKLQGTPSRSPCPRTTRTRRSAN
jgi:tripartite-type tricarboxylate transporter receptor subunit TctC